MRAISIMNYILYGNREGMPSSRGKSTNEYNDFLKSVFSKEDSRKECFEATGRDYEILDEELQ